MALLPALRVPITGDNSSLRAALAQSRRELSLFEQQATRDAQRVQASTGRMMGLQSALLKAAGVALAARQVTQYADAWTAAGNKLAAASQIAGRQARSLTDLNKIANETRTGITETADLYAKLLRATARVADSEEDVARATEIVNKAFKAGGAATSEQIAGILQLSQALGSGLLQGDELRSIRENAPLIAAAIAKEFDTTVGGLKALGAAGELEVSRIFKAILNAQPEIEAAFARTQGTIGDSWTALQNQIIESVGSLDETFGITPAFRDGFADMGEAVRGLTTFLLSMQQPIEDIDAGLQRLDRDLNDFNRSMNETTSYMPNWNSALGKFILQLGHQAAAMSAAASAAAELRELGIALQPSSRGRIGGAFQAESETSEDTALRNALRERARSFNASSLPPPPGTPPGGGSSGGGKSAAEKFQDDIDRIRRRTEAIELETRFVGENTFARERAMTVLRLEQEARDAGITNLDVYRGKIDDEATAYANATVALENRERALKAAQEAQQFLAEGLADLAMSNSFEDMAASADRLVESLKKAVIQALLLGQGPLAGIFGTQNPQGGTGGLLGGLLGGFGRGASAALPLVGAGLFHEGGKVGAFQPPERQVPSFYFDGAPRYHTGRLPGLGPRERPAILMDDEVVVPAGMLRQPDQAGWGGGSAPKMDVVINNYAGVEVSAKKVVDGRGNVRADISVQEQQIAAGQSRRVRRALNLPSQLTGR